MSNPRKPRPSRRTAHPTPAPGNGSLCPVADRCGGCQLQGMPYPEQLQRKQQQVQRLLGHLCRVEPILGMADPLHYRSKVTR